MLRKWMNTIGTIHGRICVVSWGMIYLDAIQATLAKPFGEGVGLIARS